MITYEQYEGFMNKQEEIETAILNGEKISGDIWREIAWEDLDVVDTIADMNEAGRWTCPETIIFELDSRFFSIWFERGLTEYQENEWYDQVAEEVRPKQITVTTWEVVDND